MTMNDIAVLIKELTKLADITASLIASLEQSIVPEEEKPDDPAALPAKEYTFEEARAVLAEKARAGFRAEVKAILTGHGLTQLSDVQNPKVLAVLVAEAEKIGAS